jgi:hypothetical protein
MFTEAGRLSKLNNAIANLRDVSPKVNKQNSRKAMIDSISGCLGVSQSKKRWKASIRVDGRSLYLGSFDTAELAHAAYVCAKRRLHEGCTI